jgi:hypothetical protein
MDRVVRSGALLALGAVAALAGAARLTHGSFARAMAPRARWEPQENGDYVWTGAQPGHEVEVLPMLKSRLFLPFIRMPGYQGPFFDRAEETLQGAKDEAVYAYKAQLAAARGWAR